jgi:hypothetical protein
MRRSTAAKLTAKEKAIMKALETPIKGELSGTFSQAIDYLETALGQTIVLDRQAMNEVNVTSDTEVNLKLKRATGRTVLKKLFADVGLAYVIRDESIYVTSQERAKTMMTTRTYYVGDLAGVMDVRFGPYLNQLAALQAIAVIVDSIVNGIDPPSWQVNGGMGTIAFEPITMSLIVRQTAEVHFMMGGGR